MKSFAQFSGGNLNNRNVNDNVRKGELSVDLSGKTNYTDYKVISYDNDTTYIDTTLTIKKVYKYNPRRKDNFELLAFNNIGQTYTRLGYNFRNESWIPNMGATAKTFEYFNVENVHYYYVPTPTSEILYKNAFTQGQVLNSFLTMNTSRQFNFSVQYNGLRSLGKYRNQLSSHGNFIATFNYQTKNKKYKIRGHYTSQDFSNNENGGLTAESLANFKSGNTEFNNRERLDVNYTDATNFYIGKRYYFDHEYNFLKENDSIQKQNQISIGHAFTYETKHYDFSQETANQIFGESFKSVVNDRVSNKTMLNEAYINFESPYLLGTLKGKAQYYTYEHAYKSVVFLDSQRIPAQIDGNATSIGAEWHANIKKFHLNADVNQVVAGDLTGHRYMANASIGEKDKFFMKLEVSETSRTPNFNFLLNQSSYVAYNWFNDFKNEIYRNGNFNLDTKWIDISADYTSIDNYAYFNDAEQTQASQYSGTINYLKIKAENTFKVGKFSLTNTVMYQNVLDGQEVFRVPELLTRNSLYFTDYVFKGDPLLLQTGVTFRYFTEYNANAYNPLLSEFSIQNAEKIGNFPIFDFFVSGQIRRTRIFLILENFTASFTGRDYFNAPNYPYRDFSFRFGLVWNFFI
ncbi:putative porin [Aureivirga marina]|uniref:putative porin n=1 Tax=Aureivirga marina TaxID=1182451 RepID=UPI0018C92010|nr:putative porin [Aureivirga marina]